MAVMTGTKLATMPCTSLKGVGPQVALRLEKLGIQFVQDLLFHLPLRYQDRTHVRSIASLNPGDAALVEGEIIAREMPTGGKTRLLLQIQDAHGFLHLRFFHVAKPQQISLKPGVKLSCFGEVRIGPKGFEMSHPEYRILRAGETLPDNESLTPVYPATEGLHQLSLRRFTEQALLLILKDTQLNLLPMALFQGNPFADLKEALFYVHRPPVDASQMQLLEGKHPAQQRLAFEELLAHRLSLLKAREKQQLVSAPSFPSDVALQNKLLDQLPFQLTSAQQRVLIEEESAV